MNPEKCGCNTGDEGTTFCNKHRIAFALMYAKDNNVSPMETLAALEHEGLPCSMVSYCNGHEFPDSIADDEADYRERNFGKRDRTKKVVAVWTGPDYEPPVTDKQEYDDFARTSAGGGVPDDYPEPDEDAAFERYYERIHEEKYDGGYDE